MPDYCGIACLQEDKAIKRCAFNGANRYVLMPFSLLVDEVVVEMSAASPSTLL
jgi:hypothetical protein